MADSTFWWVVTGLVVAAELMTGTFYLLMLALGLAAGALAAHAGLASAAQIASAALVGGGAVLALHLQRRRRAAAERAAWSNRDVNLDIGETVQVHGWQQDGSASVKYRGAQWSAMPAPGSPAGAIGAHRIVEVRGSQLIIEKVPS